MTQKTQSVFEIKIYLAWCFKIKVCSISKRPGNSDLFGYDLSNHQLGSNISKYFKNDNFKWKFCRPVVLFCYSDVRVFIKKTDADLKRYNFLLAWLMLLFLLLFLYLLLCWIHICYLVYVFVTLLICFYWLFLSLPSVLKEA